MLASWRKMNPMLRREAIDGYLSLTPWIIGFVAFTAIPIIISIAQSVVVMFSAASLIRAGEAMLEARRLLKVGHPSDDVTRALTGEATDTATGDGPVHDRAVRDRAVRHGADRADHADRVLHPHHAAQRVRADPQQQAVYDDVLPDAGTRHQRG